MKSYDVSVIIPCYNTFKYMEKCLNSLEHQSYKNFEVIVVDDKSTDDSVLQIEKYIEKTSLNMNLVCSEKNEGPSRAREKGVKHATGKWIAFCDADDYYENDFLKEMFLTGEINNSNCVLCEYSKVTVGGESVRVSYIDRLAFTNNLEDIIAFSQESLCVMIVKAYILRQIEFTNLYHGEDAVLIPSILLDSKKISFVNKSLYNYFMRANSASNICDKSTYYETLMVYESLQKTLKNHPIALEFLSIKHGVYNAGLNGIKAKIEFKELGIHINNVKKSYPMYRINPYFKTWSFSKKLFVFTLMNKMYSLANVMSFIHRKLIVR